MKTIRKAFPSLHLLAIIGFGLGVLLLFNACGSTNQSASTSGTQGQAMRTVIMDASWTRLYHDIKSLKQNADLAVSGTFTSIAGTIHQAKVPVMTDYAFTVKKVLLNHKNATVLPRITIRQTGGVSNNVRYKIGDDPLFTVGEQAVLFLHEFSPGHYFVIGGPSGRFQIINGQMKPVGNEGIQLSGTTSESRFYQTVQQP